jgi:Transposase IS66 family.
MAKKTAIPKIEEKTKEELDAIMQVIKDSTLSEPIKDFIIKCIEAALWFPHIIQKKNISLKRLKLMLFGKSYASDFKNKINLPADNSQDAKANGTSAHSTTLQTDDTIISKVVDDTIATNTSSIETLVNQELITAIDSSLEIKTPAPGHGRMPHTVYDEYTEIVLSIANFKPGDPCPLKDCTGKLYDFEPNKPKTLVRIVGQKCAEVHKYIVMRLRCNLCLYILEAAIPPEIGTEKYDFAFKAWIVLQKYYVAVPFYRQQNFQKLLGFPLPDSTQWDLSEQVAGCCYQIFGELILSAANGELVYGDDTKLKIQSVIQEIKSNPDMKRKGMFTSGFIAENSGHKVAIFLNGTQHAGENFSDILKKRELNKPPIIHMCDALAANIPKSQLIAGLEIIDCNCLSHGFRKFDELVDNLPIPCITIMKLLSVAYKNDTNTTEMSKEERLQYHQEHTKKYIEFLEQYLQALVDEKICEPNSEMGRAVKYMQKHWHKLIRFLSVAGAPLCNNIVERSLKIAIRNRKAAMFYRTPYSAHIGGMLTSIIYTCELNKVNPYDYLIAVQKHYPSVAENASTWLPWNYKHNITHPPNLATCANH